MSKSGNEKNRVLSKTCKDCGKHKQINDFEYTYTKNGITKNFVGKVCNECRMKARRLQGKKSKLKRKNAFNKLLKSKSKKDKTLLSKLLVQREKEAQAKREGTKTFQAFAKWRSFKIGSAIAQLDKEIFCEQELRNILIRDCKTVGLYIHNEYGLLSSSNLRLRTLIDLYLEEVKLFIEFKQGEGTCHKNYTNEQVSIYENLYNLSKPFKKELAGNHRFVSISADGSNSDYNLKQGYELTLNEITGKYSKRLFPFLLLSKFKTLMNKRIKALSKVEYLMVNSPLYDEAKAFSQWENENMPFYEEV